MQNILLILIILYLYSGCSQVNSISEYSLKEELSCSTKAKPKSLQLLEQQYRCRSQE